MNDPNQSTTPESLILDPKQFLTEEQFLELWDTRGMKYRFDELHQRLLDRGLQTHINQPIFRQAVFEILKQALVEGQARRDPKKVPLQRWPKVH